MEIDQGWGREEQWGSKTGGVEMPRYLCPLPFFKTRELWVHTNVQFIKSYRLGNMQSRQSQHGFQKQNTLRHICRDPCVESVFKREGRKQYNHFPLGPELTGAPWLCAGRRGSGQEKNGKTVKGSHQWALWPPGIQQAGH